MEPFGCLPRRSGRPAGWIRLNGGPSRTLALMQSERKLLLPRPMRGRSRAVAGVCIGGASAASLCGQDIRRPRLGSSARAVIGHPASPDACAAACRTKIHLSSTDAADDARRARVASGESRGGTSRKKAARNIPRFHDFGRHGLSNQLFVLKLINHKILHIKFHRKIEQIFQISANINDVFICRLCY